jgi:transcriptional regulator with XRE-family HTH domain
MVTQYFFREWREHAGLSQRQLARLIGVTKTTISRIEAGKRAFTSDFLEDFQKSVRCAHVWDPLARAPDIINGTPISWLNDAEVEKRIFERAREIRKTIRKQEDNPKGNDKPRKRKRG